jgi:hypothetical protein
MEIIFKKSYIRKTNNRISTGLHNTTGKKSVMFISLLFNKTHLTHLTHKYNKISRIRQVIFTSVAATISSFVGFSLKTSRSFSALKKIKIG